MDSVCFPPHINMHERILTHILLRKTSEQILNEDRRMNRDVTINGFLKLYNAFVVYASLRNKMFLVFKKFN